MITQPQKNLAQRGQLLLLGHGVDPVDQGQLLPREMSRHHFIGQDHELFDERFGTARPVPLHAGDVPVFVENKLRFGNVEIKSAAPQPFLPQQRRQPAHLLQHLAGVRPVAVKLLFTGKIGLHLGVSQAPCHPHDAG